MHVCRKPEGAGCEFKYNGDCIRPDEIDFCVRTVGKHKNTRNEKNSR